MARPSEYKEEYCDKADEFLTLYEDKEMEREGKNGDNVVYGLKVKLPTLKGFARFIGVNESTLYEWDKKYPAFSKSLENIKTEQHERLVNEGLSGNYNPTIAKLILSSNHGMAERKEVKAEVTLPSPILNAIPTDNSDNEDNEAEEED